MAPDAEDGKKLIDFLLSRDAQEQVSKIAQGFPVRQDVQPTDETYKKLHDLMNGVRCTRLTGTRCSAGCSRTWRAGTRRRVVDDSPGGP